MMNLQEANKKITGSTSAFHSSRFESVIFQRVVGSLGGSLIPEHDALEEMSYSAPVHSTAVHPDREHISGNADEDSAFRRSFEGGVKPAFAHSSPSYDSSLTEMRFASV